MPSLVTQNIGQAVASTVSPNNQAATQSKVAAPISNQQQLHQDLRASSQAATVSLKIPDKERTPQLPKRAEATYSSIPKKRKPGNRTPEEDQEQNPNSEMELHR